MALYWPPRLKKKYHQFWESQFVTLGTNIVAFISNLGRNNKPKMLKIGPKFFWALKIMPYGISVKCPVQ
jgi:hypothetical protein